MKVTRTDKTWWQALVEIAFPMAIGVFAGSGFALLLGVPDTWPIVVVVLVTAFFAAAIDVEYDN